MANDETGSNYISFPMTEGIPTAAVLGDAYQKAKDNKGKTVQIPFRADATGALFNIAVSVGEWGEESWTLYKGEGMDGTIEWNSAYTDLEYIHDVLIMSAAQAKEQAAAEEKSAAKAPEAGSSPAPSGPSTEPSSAEPELKPVDASLFEKRPNVLLGQILVDSGMLSDKDLEKALEVQEKVRDGKMESEEAMAHLRKGLAKMKEMEKKADAEKRKENAQAGQDTQKGLDILKQAGSITEDDIQTAVISKLGGDVGKMLVSTGKIDLNTFEAAVECQSMIERGSVKTEAAIIALHYCHRMRVKLKEALEETGSG